MSRRAGAAPHSALLTPETLLPARRVLMARMNTPYPASCISILTYGLGVESNLDRSSSVDYTRIERVKS